MQMTYALYPINEHMQQKLDDLWKESKKVGLEINHLKTEEIRVNKIIIQVLKLNGVYQEIIKLLSFG